MTPTGITARGISRRIGLLASLAVAANLIAGSSAALPYQIGHRSVTYSDPARNNRSVPTEIYYPADSPGDNVPVALGEHPVVVFGHGYLMPWSVYSFLWTGLAPEGYILALPRTEGGLFPSHAEFGRDLAFLVQKLRAEGENPSSPFYERIAQAAAVMGHSMGGGASFLAAAADGSLTAIANLAAAETNPSAIQAASGIVIPALLFSGSHDCVTPPAQHQTPMYAALASACKTHVTITGASHCQFADYNSTCSLGEGGCPSPTITRAQQHAMTLELLRPWLDFTLKGEPEGWTEFQHLLDAAQGIAFAQDCEALSADEAVRGDSRRDALRCSPNPLRGAAVLSFTLLAPASVELSIRDPLGRTVRRLTREPFGIGRHSIPWDGRDDAGRELPAGVYWGCLNDQTRRVATGLVLVR